MKVNTYPNFSSHYFLKNYDEIWLNSSIVKYFFVDCNVRIFHLNYVLLQYIRRLLNKSTGHFFHQYGMILVFHRNVIDSEHQNKYATYRRILYIVRNRYKKKKKIRKLSSKLP